MSEIQAFDAVVPTKSSNYITCQHIMRYVFASTLVAGKTVLDIACGAGYGASHFVACGAKEVVGVDLSKNAVAYARNQYSKKGLHLLQGNAVFLPLRDRSFDMVVSFETIEHINEYEEYLEEMKRVLKPQGTFICSTPNIAYTQHPYYHVKEFRPAEFFDLLENHFDYVQRYGQYISLFTRVNDVLRVIPYRIARKTLSFTPHGDRIKEFLKKEVFKSIERVNPRPHGKEVHEMCDQDPMSFKNCKVEPLSKKGSSQLLRIMLAVCKGQKR